MDIEKVSLQMNPEPAKICNEHWIELAGKYSADTEVVKKLFSEIETAYTASGRHYHNLNHIASLIQLSNQYQTYLKNKDIVEFSIFYHDIVYQPSRGDNESKSAQAAENAFLELQFPKQNIADVVKYIKATKSHKLDIADQESDLAWFLDFDMSILGMEWDIYVEYTRQVRQEYGIYPDFIYNPGRIKFLQETLRQPYMFNTNVFRTYFEHQARENMRKEIVRLES
jgi:predicted metal-dependent HD superfamily phosphohydrolase